MTKFECLNSDCKKTFLYTAKRIESKTDMTTDMNELVFETHVCPYCHSLNFQEYVEPVVVEEISSVKSVELDKVDEMIAQGYKVKELYAKTATMIKKEKQDNVTILRKQLYDIMNVIPYPCWITNEDGGHIGFSQESDFLKFQEEWKKMKALLEVSK